MRSRSPRVWRIVSSSGRFECTASLAQAVTADALLAELHILGRFWDRKEETLGGLENADLVSEYSASFQQVIVSRRKLSHLHEHLCHWLNEPRKIDQDLQAREDQTFRISFGSSEELISSTDKPVCTILVETCSMKATWESVVDQTCIREACEGLRTWLD